MAPETTSNNPGTNARILAVPMPEAGEALAIRAEAGAEIQFDFPLAGTLAERQGADLVIEIEANGGTVTLTNFFAVPTQAQLPSLTFSDYSFTGLDYAQANGINPILAADGAQSGGINPFNGDPGAFTDGVNRLEDQGTFYWGRQFSVDREDEGMGRAGGTFDLGAFTFGVEVAYEDGKPWQWREADGGETRYARLEFNPSPAPGNRVGEVRISDLPEGAEVYVWDPVAGDYQLESPGPDGIYRFQPSDFVHTDAEDDRSGVYIKPPFNSDADFTFKAEVDFTYQGNTHTETNIVPVIVDAVADKISEEDMNGSANVTDDQSDKLTGHSKDTTEASEVTVKVDATFQDVADGSEHHYIVVKDIPTDWILNPSSIPAGWTLIDKDGNPVAPENVAKYIEDLAAANKGVNGEYSLKFDVTEAAQKDYENSLDPNKADHQSGSVGAELKFDPQDWTSSGATDDSGQVIYKDAEGNIYYAEAGGYVNAETGEAAPAGTAIYPVGRWSDGTLHEGGYVDENGNYKLSMDAIASESPVVGANPVPGVDNQEPFPTGDPDNEFAGKNDAVTSIELDPIQVVEDTPDLDMGSSKNSGQGQGGHTDIVGNVAVGESPEVSGGHGGGEYVFHGDSGSRQLPEVISNVIKGVADKYEVSDDYDYPLGIQHANGNTGNKNDTGAVEAGRDNIKFDLHSDGRNDTHAASDTPGKASVGWASADEVLSDVKGKNTVDVPTLYSKTTGELAVARTFTGSDGKTYDQEVNDDGYAQLQFRVSTETGADGSEHSVMVGFFFDANGNEVIALMGVLSPDYSAGEANITFVQYTPLWHPYGASGSKLANEDNMQSYFKVKVVDDDGDVTYGHVQFRSLDDVPVIGANYKNLTETLNEKETDNISGNVIADSKADSGSDGWYGGGNKGVLEFDLDLPQGYTVELNGQPVASLNDLKPVVLNSEGKPVLDNGNEVPNVYVIKDANGNVQGEFSMDREGNWTFREGNGEILKDFDINVNYTLKDADGDRVEGNLNIDINAAPNVLNLEGSTKVYESTGLENNDSPEVASYTLSLRDWNDSSKPVEGDAVTENITATLRIDLNETTKGDFAFEVQGGKTVIKYTYEVLENGPDGPVWVEKTAYAEVNEIGYPNVTAIEFDVTIPAGSKGAVDFELPIAEDFVGGTGSAKDSPLEDYSVSIKEVVSGNALTPEDAVKEGSSSSANLKSEAETTIVDDGVNETTGQYNDNEVKSDGSGYNHAADNHPLDGPLFKLSGVTSMNEGQSRQFTLGESVNPNTGVKYAAGNDAGERVTSEPVSVTMTFTCGAGFVPGSSGDVVVTGMSVTGVTYQYSPDGGTTWVNIPSSGIPGSAFDGNGSVEIKVNLPENFDLNNLGNVGIKVEAKNDNHTEPAENFEVKISGASGGESTYDGSVKVVEVNDTPRKNVLGISDADRVWEGDELTYNLTFSADTKITTTNTDTVVVTLEFGSATDTATRGADFNLAAIKQAILDANPDKGLVITINEADGTLDVSIPSGAWQYINATGSGADKMYNYKLPIDVPTTHDNIFGENDESITVTIKGVNQVNGSNAAELTIDPNNNSGTGIVEDRGALTLTKNGVTDIYEDSAMGSTNITYPTVASYNVNFNYDSGAAVGTDSKGNPVFHYVTKNTDPAGFEEVVAGTDFTFNVSLKGANSNVKFDANTKDNDPDKFKGDPEDNYYGTDGTLGDFGWAIGGTLIEYGDLTTEPGKKDLMDAINKYLEDNDFDGIRVADVINGGSTLVFEVEAGADLSNPLPIQVGSIDDRQTEGKEVFDVIISDIKSTDGAEKNHENIVIDKERQQDGSITDDYNTSDRDGFFVGVDKGQSWESDGSIKVPVVLFERDENGNLVGAAENNPPTQNITVTIKVPVDADGNPMVWKDGDGNIIVADSAWLNHDFYMNADGTLTFVITPGAGNWSYVAENTETGVPGHWVSNNVKIPLNDDRLSEGDEKFTVEIINVSGHESEKLPDGKVPGMGSSNQQTILDDSWVRDENGNWVNNKQDGPGLMQFGPKSEVIEPVAPNQPGGTAGVVKVVDYQVVMTHDVAEDTIVFIDIKNPGNNWSDFEPVIGDASSRPLTSGQLYSVDDFTAQELADMFPNFGYRDASGNYQTGLDPNGGKYFTIIEEGSASGSFKVEIKHDHDEKGIEQGVDNSKLPGAEEIDMTITNIQGSENVFDKYDPKTINPDGSVRDENGAHSNEKIADDMRGPLVTLGQNAEVYIDQDGNAVVTLTANMTTVATEDVYLIVDILGPDGALIKQVEVKIPAGATHDSLDVKLDGVDYIYTQVAGSRGGESQTGHEMGFTNMNGGGGTEPWRRVELGVEATNIHEQGETTVGYTITGKMVNDPDLNQELSFTLKVRDGDTNSEDPNSDFKQGGEGKDITITIPADMLSQCPDGFRLEVTKDGVVMYDSNIPGQGNVVTGSGVKVDGKLSQAFDDKLVEGNEDFYTIITNISGNNTIDSSSPIGKSEIIDNDTPIVRVVYFDKDGNEITSAQEGHGPVYGEVQIGMYDSQGNWVEYELGNGDATFNLKTNASGTDTATGGTDYALEYDSVVIKNGESHSDRFEVFLPDDYQTEGNEHFVITPEYNPGPYDVTNYPGGTFISDSNANSGKLEITDYINGPVLSFSTSTPKISEGGSNNEAKYWVTLSDALEQDATITFKVVLNDKFTADDIATINVNGQKIAIADIDNDSSKPVYFDAEGNIIVNMEMGSGFSKGGFSITMNNDYISEGSESYQVVIVGSTGGELQLPSVKGDPNSDPVDLNKAGYSPEANVEVTDYLDGPSIALRPVTTEGVEGESINVAIDITGGVKGGEILSDTTITLTLGNKVASDLIDPMTGTDGEGNTYSYITVTGPNGELYEGVLEVDGDGKFTGKVAIDLPEGAKGPLNVEFPLKDDAKSNSTWPEFKVSLDESGISGGEASLASSKSYDGTFMQETNTSVTFELSGEAASAGGNGVININNIPNGAEGGQFIAGVTVGGVTYTVESGQVVWNSEAGAWQVNLPGKVTSLDGYDVTVSFKNLDANGGLDNKGNPLGNVKMNVSVGGSLSGQEISVGVVEDSGAQNDGPQFTVVANSSVAQVEGSTFDFTIKPNAKVGFEETEETVTVTFKVEGSNVNLAGVDLALPAGATFDRNGSVFTVTMPKGTNLEDITVHVPTNTDNKIGGTSGNVKVTITGSNGGESSYSGTAAQTAISDSTATTAQLLLSQAAANADVVEGNNIVLNMALKNGAADATSNAAVKVSFHLNAPEGSIASTGYMPSGTTVKWVEGTGGNEGYYLVETSLPKGSSSVDVKIPTVATPNVNEGDRTYEIDTVTIDAGAYGSGGTGQISLGTVPSLEYNVSENDAIKFLENETANSDGVYDFSSATEALTIHGSDGDESIIGSNFGDIINAGAGTDIIYGGGGKDKIFGGEGEDSIFGDAGNDLIFGGAGNDQLTGGTGDDTFAWSTNDFGANADGSPFHDIIHDFSMQATGNATKSGLFGNDQIDLGGLLPNGATLGNLSDYVTIDRSEDGKSATLKVTDGSDNLLQTIELENVYTNHSVNNNHDAVDAMILQHIILTNNG